MGTIVCRHRNETIFDRLSDNYSRSIAFHWVVASKEKNGKKILTEKYLEPSHLQAYPEHNESENKIYLRWYQSKKSSIDSPSKVIKDVHINDDTFISLCGHICNTVDYNKTDDVFDITELVTDIVSRQPDHNSPHEKDVFIKNKVLHFNEIPSTVSFAKMQGRDFHMGFMYQRVTKYHRDDVYDKGTSEDNMRGRYCPFVSEGFYKNMNFYEDDAVWYNPNKRYVQLNHAVSSNNFFDKDGYLCSSYNYELITEEEIKHYEKIFLFLI